MNPTELVVFDLDFTLWDCGGTWCDHTTPPYRINGAQLLDAHGVKIRLYDDVLDILQSIAQIGLPMALASRTYEPTWAKQLLQLFDIDNYFVEQQIFPASKVTHFTELHRATGIAYERMVFFDDEMRNIQEVGALGVNAVYVEHGLNWPLFKQYVTLNHQGSEHQHA